MKSKKKKATRPKNRNLWDDPRVRHACARTAETIGDRIQIFPPPSAMLQAWIDGSAKPPVQGARMMLIALAREVLTWREDHLRKQRCSIETESGTFQIEIPKEAMDRIRALVRRGSHRPPGDDAIDGPGPHGILRPL